MTTNDQDRTAGNPPATCPWSPGDPVEIVPSPGPPFAQGVTDEGLEFQTLFEVLPDAVVVVNQHGEMMLMNAQME